MNLHSFIQHSITQYSLMYTYEHACIHTQCINRSKGSINHLLNFVNFLKNLAFVHTRKKQKFKNKEKNAFLNCGMNVTKGRKRSQYLQQPQNFTANCIFSLFLSHVCAHVCAHIQKSLFSYKF